MNSMISSSLMSLGTRLSLIALRHHSSNPSTCPVSAFMTSVTSA